VVPNAEIDHWIDAPPALVAHLFGVANRIGRAQQLAFDPQRVGLIVAGYEVPHMHIHVVPTNDMSEMNFANAATTVDREDLESAAAAIRNALAG
jgi:diadenosine tetraphosphate (Ap4A) HIT family hydrolase